MLQRPHVDAQHAAVEDGPATGVLAGREDVVDHPQNRPSRVQHGPAAASTKSVATGVEPADPSPRHAIREGCRRRLGTRRLSGGNARESQSSIRARRFLGPAAPGAGGSHARPEPGAGSSRNQPSNPFAAGSPPIGDQPTPRPSGMCILRRRCCRACGPAPRSLHEQRDSSSAGRPRRSDRTRPLHLACAPRVEPAAHSRPERRGPPQTKGGERSSWCCTSS